MLFMWIRTHVGICMYDYIYSLKIKNSFSKNLTFAMPAAAAKLLQLCLTLCDPKDYSLPGSSVYGILQVRILECVAIPFSRGSPGHRDWTLVSHLLHWQVGSLLLAPPGSKLMFVTKWWFVENEERPSQTFEERVNLDNNHLEKQNFTVVKSLVISIRVNLVFEGLKE